MVNGIYWLQKNVQIMLTMKSYQYCPQGYRMAKKSDYIRLQEKAHNYIIISEDLLQMQLDKMYLGNTMNEQEVQVVMLNSSLFTFNFSSLPFSNKLSLFCKCLSDTFDSSQLSLSFSPQSNLFTIGQSIDISIYSPYNLLLTQIYFLQDQSITFINTNVNNTNNVTFKFVPLIIGCSKIFINVQFAQSQVYSTCFQYFSQFPSLPLLSDDYLYSQLINPVQMQFNINIAKISKQNMEINQYQIAIRQEGGVYIGFSEQITQKIQVIRLTEKWKYQWGQQIDLQISGKFLGIADTFLGFAIIFKQQQSQGLSLIHYDYVGNQIFTKIINNNSIFFYFQNSTGLFLDPQFYSINNTLKANLEVIRDLFLITLLHSNNDIQNIITLVTINIWNNSIINLVYYQPNSYFAYNVIEFKSLFDQFQFYYLLVHSQNNLYLFQINIFKIQTSITDPFFNIKNRIQQAKRDVISLNFNNILEQQQFQCGSYSELLSCLRISSLFNYKDYIGFFYSSYQLILNSSQGISNEYEQLGIILYHKNNMTLAIKKTIISNISNITNIKQQQISQNVFLLSLIVTNRLYKNNNSQPFLADDIDYSQDKSLVYLFDIQKNILFNKSNQSLLCNELDQYQRTPNNNIVWSFLDNNQFYLRYLDFNQEENYMKMLESQINIKYMGLGTQVNKIVYQNETKYRSMELLIWINFLLLLSLTF